MTETVVHVTTLEQWKSVLDVWFEQGYTWFHFEKGDYLESVFSGSHHYLHLDDYISQTPDNYDNEPFIEYSEFMAQQEKETAKETYYVTQEQLDLIEYLNDEAYPLLALAMNTFAYGSDFEEKFDPNILFTDEFIGDSTVALAKYLGGDTSIEFKVKEQLYCLYHTEKNGRKRFMSDWESTTTSKKLAFTAPLEEIKKWQTPAWEIEKAD
ncbi:hypothetical protein ACT5YT_05585 [Leuconostoc suionicum]|uniref:hypothetical protein n=1 Tax=Leuconostoc suionicum TaxID=1511761 RepID=UPI0040359DF3